MLCRRSGQPGRFSFSRRAHLLTTCESRRWQPSRWSGSCALHEVPFSRFSRGGRQCRKRALPVQLAAIFCLNIKTVVKTSQLPAKTCCRQLCRRYGYRCSGDPHFLFAKKKQKRREGENKWQSTIWKQKWSAGAMGVLLLPLPPI